ncbi:hypothetical protein FVE85_0276 [Porphyridium purpureum]|uniref:Uncharacterized protein n=1 Tax=Porphyridium purpureum TaxID=35688 RepID=A0A5J4Z1J6_PORPP|nr:hypothetical protein FVE85_0276 [Porphyridium purpureum]|eukprot:POR4853..scf208_2
MVSFGPSGLRPRKRVKRVSELGAVEFEASGAELMDIQAAEWADALVNKAQRGHNSDEVARLDGLATHPFESAVEVGKSIDAALVEVSSLVESLGASIGAVDKVSASQHKAQPQGQLSQFQILNMLAVETKHERSHHRAELAVSAKSAALKRAAQTLKHRKKELESWVQVQHSRSESLLSLRHLAGGLGNLHVSESGAGSISLKVFESAGVSYRLGSEPSNSNVPLTSALTTHPDPCLHLVLQGDEQHQPSAYHLTASLADAGILPGHSGNVHQYDVDQALNEAFTPNLSALSLSEENESQSENAGGVTRNIDRIVSVIRGRRVEQCYRELFKDIIEEICQSGREESSEAHTRTFNVASIGADELVMGCGSMDQALALRAVQRSFNTSALVETSGVPSENPILALGPLVRMLLLSSYAQHEFGHGSSPRSVRMGNVEGALESVSQMVSYLVAIDAMYQMLVYCCEKMRVHVRWIRSLDMLLEKGDRGRMPHLGFAAQIWATAYDGDGTSALLGTVYVNPFKLEPDFQGTSEGVGARCTDWVQFFPALSLAMIKSWSVEAQMPRSMPRDLLAHDDPRSAALANDAPRSVQIFHGIRSTESWNKLTPADSQLPDMISILLCVRLLDELEVASRYSVPYVFDIDRQGFSILVCDLAHRSILGKVRPGGGAKRPHLTVYLNYKEDTDQQTQVDLPATDFTDQEEGRIGKWMDLLSEMVRHPFANLDDVRAGLVPRLGA